MTRVRASLVPKYDLRVHVRRCGESVKAKTVSQSHCCPRALLVSVTCTRPLSDCQVHTHTHTHMAARPRANDEDDGDTRAQLQTIDQRLVDAVLLPADVIRSMMVFDSKGQRVRVADWLWRAFAAEETNPDIPRAISAEYKDAKEASILYAKRMQVIACVPVGLSLAGSNYRKGQSEILARQFAFGVPQDARSSVATVEQLDKYMSLYATFASYAFLSAEHQANPDVKHWRARALAELQDHVYDTIGDRTREIEMYTDAQPDFDCVSYAISDNNEGEINKFMDPDSLAFEQ